MCVSRVVTRGGVAGCSHPSGVSTAPTDILVGRRCVLARSIRRGFRRKKENEPSVHAHGRYTVHRLRRVLEGRAGQRDGCRAGLRRYLWSALVHIPRNISVRVVLVHTRAPVSAILSGRRFVKPVAQAGPGVLPCSPSQSVHHPCRSLRVPNPWSKTGTPPTVSLYAPPPLHPLHRMP